MKTIVQIFLLVCVVCCGYTYAAVTQAEAERACGPVAVGSPFDTQCKKYIGVSDYFEGCVEHVLREDSLAASSLPINSGYSSCAGIATAFGEPVPTIFPVNCGATTVITRSEVKPGAAYTITFRAYDINGAAKTTGGDDFTVVGEPAPLTSGTPVDNGDGTYTFTTTLPECDEVVSTPFSLLVQCRGFEEGPSDPSSVETCATYHGNGDPHFIGYWKQPFDYQGVGDYYLATFGNIVVQNRQQQTCGAPGASCNVGVAVKFGNTSKLELFTGPSFKLNGIIAPVPGVGQTLNVTNNGDSIARTSSSSYVIRTSVGKIDVIDYGTFFNLFVTARKAITQGLFSPQGRNGEPFGAYYTIARPFGDSWRVQNESDSVFTYPTNTFDTINQPNANQTYECDATPAIVAKAEAACQLLSAEGDLATQCAQFVPTTAQSYQACLFDILCTGDDSFAQNSLDIYGDECIKKANTTIALPTSARQCTTDGTGLTSPRPLFATSIFTIIARDSKGVRKPTGGDVFQITSSPRPVTFNKIDHNNGSQTVLYTLALPGIYTISIKTGGIHIQGSPYTVTAA